jgi:hypothetical protein
MSDEQHECGIALVVTTESLSFIKRIQGLHSQEYTENVSSNGKQHNRGQDGAGFTSVKRC